MKTIAAYLHSRICRSGVMFDDRRPRVVDLNETADAMMIDGPWPIADEVWRAFDRGR